LETEQDVIAGNKLIFENEEHIEAMKEHLDNRDAQISQKLRHLWPYVTNLKGRREGGIEGSWQLVKGSSAAVGSNVIFPYFYLQVSFILQKQFSDKVRKSLNDHAKKGKAGNVKKLLTGKTGHAKRSRTI
jgi:hypothetical protein